MNAMAKDVVPARRIHLPGKILGENFYACMYGIHRCLRLQAMVMARLRKGEERASAVKEARRLNHECVWYLQRTVKR